MAVPRKRKSKKAGFQNMSADRRIQIAHDGGKTPHVIGRRAERKKRVKQKT